MDNIINNSEIVLSNVYIREKVLAIANDINIEYKCRLLTVVPILDAAFMFTSDLIKHIDTNMEFSFIKVISYHDGVPTHPELYVNFDTSAIKSKDILIVDTIIDSGNTMRFVKNYLECLSPNSIKICALVVKNNKDNKDINVDFSHVSNVDGFLFGYGTDYKDGTCRNLEHIYRKVNKMETINDAYGEYLNKKVELDRLYNDKVRIIKEQRIDECPLKKGMIVKFHNWTGRVLFVDFTGPMENQQLQAMIMDSRTIVRIPINESEFDRIEVLEEPEALDMKLVGECIARIEKEEEEYKLKVEELNLDHENKMTELDKDLEIIRRDCIHDWNMVQPSKDDELGNNPKGYMYKCEICKKTETRQFS